MQKFPLRANPNFFKESTLIQSRALSIYMQPNTSGESRYAVVVPKKIVSLATRRNALKRQILSLLLRPDFYTETVDAVFRVGNRQLLDERSKIEYELKNIFDKANLWI